MSSAQNPDGIGSEEKPLRVAIVGSGPSGFYAAAGLFKVEGLNVSVDVFDRLPTPFGLVRGGVAPDHQKIKNVIRVYNKTAGHENFRFFGNVQIGRDISVQELATFYDQIIFAVGNESDRKMGLPGEDLVGVHSATEFVGWYNGHPDFQDLEFDLESATKVAVIGNGNVAMDVARILAQPSQGLEATDITERSLAMLRKSKVQEVVILGRRGPAQAAFSPKEIKEIGGLEGVDLVVSKQDATLDEMSQAWLENAAPSAKKNVDYLLETATAEPQEASDVSQRKVICRFLVSPTEFRGENGNLNQVVIEQNELTADDRGTPRPRGTGVTETLDVDLVFKAVGYRGVALEGVPFHEKWGVFPNVEGRITEVDSEEPILGQYVVGWAKRGPSGLIGTNGPDSVATVEKMVEDLAAGKVQMAENRDQEAIVRFLAERNVDPVTYADWALLDADEVENGEAKGKVREKLTAIDAMMSTIQKLRTKSTT